MKVPQHIRALLDEAYRPCPGFTRSCESMKWSPNQGHVPRGFWGATGTPEQVKLILVVAEPGDPHSNEIHSGLESAYMYTRTSFIEGTDLFHRNVRYISDGCFPDQTFEQQEKHVWFTESVLCSAPSEGASIPAGIERACGERFLKKQVEVFNKAVLVALGTKARNRLKKIGLINFITAISVAPPGCNRRDAKSSWDKVIEEVSLRNSI